MCVLQASHLVVFLYLQNTIRFVITLNMFLVFIAFLESVPTLEIGFVD